jgi:hypothetical protein
MRITCRDLPISNLHKYIDLFQCFRAFSICLPSGISLPRIMIFPLFAFGYLYASVRSEKRVTRPQCQLSHVTVLAIART